MKTLTECIFANMTLTNMALTNMATPMNTTGMGNVDVATEPICIKSKKKTKLIVPIKKYIKRRIDEYNTPDYITFDYEDIQFNLYWSDKMAHVFVYDSVDKKCIIGGNDVHLALWNKMSEKEQQDFSHGLFTDIDRIRYVDDNENNKRKNTNSASKVYNIWANNPRFKEARERFICGRLWDIEHEWDKYVDSDYLEKHPDFNENTLNVVCIAFWNELKEDKYLDCAKNVFAEYAKTKKNTKDAKLFGVDNNANIIPIDNNTKIDDASEESKMYKKLAQAIHLATQREKEDFYKEFKKNRDENNQKKYYNHTKSKTEAEYRALKYQESLTAYIEGKKKIVRNDKGEIVPDTCDKCGGEVVVQIHGEPVYICKKCGKYFGTMPCNL